MNWMLSDFDWMKTNLMTLRMSILSLTKMQEIDYKLFKMKQLSSNLNSLMEQTNIIMLLKKEQDLIDLEIKERMIKIP